MLAQILPGFRDFRTPLVTGYLWLLSTWILLGKPVPTKDRKDGLMGTVNALSEYLSPALVLGVLSFVAYIVGMLLMMDTKVVAGVVRRFGWTLRRSVTRSGRARYSFRLNAFVHDYERLVNTNSGSTMRRLLWEAFKRVEKREVPSETIYAEYDVDRPDEEKEKAFNDKAQGDPDKVEELKRRDAMTSVSTILLSDMEAEIPTMATKLQEKNKDLYDAYSKDKSEAEFRLSVAFPIATASVLIYFMGLFSNPTLNTWVSAAGFIAALVLLKKGWTKTQEATNIIITALDIDVIKSKVLERLDGLRGPQILTEMGDPVIR